MKEDYDFLWLLGTIFGIAIVMWTAMAIYSLDDTFIAFSTMT